MKPGPAPLPMAVSILPFGSTSPRGALRPGILLEWRQREVGSKHHWEGFVVTATGKEGRVQVAAEWIHATYLRPTWDGVATSCLD